MYPSRHDLGRFDVPDGESWPLRVSYVPEPPQAIRGSMNPWEQERKRQLYLIENQAWEQIRKLQGDYRAKVGEFEYHSRRYNQLIPELEKQTGQRGFMKLINSKEYQMASQAASTALAFSGIGAPIALLVQLNQLIMNFAYKGFTQITGETGRKKKRIAELQRAIEDQVKHMQRIYEEMQQLASDILHLTNTRERGMLQQSENVKVDMANNAIQIAQRRIAQSTAAAAHSAKAAAARLLPQKVMNDAL